MRVDTETSLRFFDEAPAPPERAVRSLGVLGGMGPLATAYFFESVVRATPATSDQAHIPTLVWSDGRVPDRTLAIQGRGPSPVPMMASGLRVLASAGADVIAIPCNTAHAFLPELVRATDREIVDMIHETVAAALAANPSLTTLGVLCTTGTRSALLYEKAAAQLGVTVAHVSRGQQSALVDEAIRIVKRGGRSELAERLIAEAAISLADQGAQAVVAACTELPLVSAAAGRVLPIVDSVDALARAAVRLCLQPFL